VQRLYNDEVFGERFCQQDTRRRTSRCHARGLVTKNPVSLRATIMNAF
jgi:hypothetical protein